MFEDYFRGQMAVLMHKIIDAVCDPNNDSAGDTRRVTNLKN